MSTALHQSNLPLRSESWNGILDIVDRLGHLDFGGTIRPLMVDQSIKPHLRTSDECIGILTTRMSRPISSSLRQFLQTRVNQLRERMLSSYTESVSQMASYSELTGLDDKAVQRSHTRSIETWFDQAIEELFTVIIEHPKVRTTI
jgi:hypothetical protein